MDTLICCQDYESQIEAEELSVYIHTARCSRLFRNYLDYVFVNVIRRAI